MKRAAGAALWFSARTIRVTGLRRRQAPPPEKHPEIRDALAAVRNAKVHLEPGAHDFGGHRVDAIRATDEAIRQLEICLQYDKD